MLMESNQIFLTAFSLAIIRHLIFIHFTKYTRYTRNSALNILEYTENLKQYTNILEYIDIHIFYWGQHK